MENTSPYSCSKDKMTIFETTFAFAAFTLTLLFSKEHFEVNFSSVIGLVLYFMIFIELTRTLFDFIFGPEHKLKVRLIFDLGIIFTIREILVTITSNHHHIKDEIYFLSISSIFLIILYILRVIDAKIFKHKNIIND